MSGIKVDTTFALQFTYGGCGGNKNNFVTLRECQDACEKSVDLSRSGKDGDEGEEDPCDLEPSAGPCSDQVRSGGSRFATVIKAMFASLPF